MKSCRFENYFADYISGELDKNEILSFQAHLDCCSTCPKRLDEFYEIHNILNKRKRVKAPSELLTNYHKTLKQKFSNHKIGSNWKQQIGRFIQSVFWERSLRLKIAEVVSLIFIGIIIGWFIFTPQPAPLINVNGNIEYFSAPISKAEVEYISYYLQAAELLLLEINNIEINSPINKSEIEFNKTIAQKLLIKTFIIHEIALRQNDPKILRFLSKMELLLYEVSNVSAKELDQSIDIFKVIINNSNLLDDARKFQKEFIDYRILSKSYNQPIKTDEVK